MIRLNFKEQDPAPIELLCLNARGTQPDCLAFGVARTSNSDVV